MSVVGTSHDLDGNGALFMLQIVFIVLKLVNCIDWSWWVVLIPTWISLFVFLIAVVIIICIDRK